MSTGTGTTRGVDVLRASDGHVDTPLLAEQVRLASFDRARSAVLVLARLEDSDEGERCWLAHGREGALRQRTGLVVLRVAATGLEALFGWLYLRGEHARLNELFAAIMEEDDDAS